MKASSHPSATALAVLTAAVLTATVVTGCSPGGDHTGDAAGTSGGVVKRDFWGWAPGYDQSVALFNRTHPNIQVAFDMTASGSKGGYTKTLTAAKAGNAPRLTQVGYETLPSFDAAGALSDVTKYASAARPQFADWTWKQVTIGGRT
ncbi:MULTISPECIES: extracellular solute-binding protein [Kitasatospora]|uniref:Sugar ABC transporter substrate-binding protein n=1 Tax=Kitasatospora cathayae TaxID=3004092 RepID=A0ABY7PVV1_9ACTN|nr:extracellular solute-binding protein [Kitasatospora sp. HUAS 3-15]WBP84567.1 hypothetical protein O1G21_00955 [Kitasatospora sp. HUAS 3-15]